MCYQDPGSVWTAQICYQDIPGDWNKVPVIPGYPRLSATVHPILTIAGKARDDWNTLTDDSVEDAYQLYIQTLVYQQCMSVCE